MEREVSALSILGYTFILGMKLPFVCIMFLPLDFCPWTYRMPQEDNI